MLCPTAADQRAGLAPMSLVQPWQPHHQGPQRCVQLGCQIGRRTDAAPCVQKVYSRLGRQGGGGTNQPSGVRAAGQGRSCRAPLPMGRAVISYCACRSHSSCLAVEGGADTLDTLGAVGTLGVLGRRDAPEVEQTDHDVGSVRVRVRIQIQERALRLWIHWGARGEHPTPEGKCLLRIQRRHQPK